MAYVKAGFETPSPLIFPVILETVNTEQSIGTWNGAQKLHRS